MKFIVDKSWAKSEKKIKFWNYIEQYERASDVSIPRLAKAVGICQDTVRRWIYEVGGAVDLSREARRKEYAARAREIIASVQYISSTALAREARFPNTHEAHAYVRKNCPGYDEKVVKVKGPGQNNIRFIIQTRQIKELAAQGFMWGEIAEKVGVSYNTVRKTLSDAFDPTQERQMARAEEQWEKENLHDFVTPDDDYCTIQRDRGIMCFPRAIWERYRKIWESKVAEERRETYEYFEI